MKNDFSVECWLFNQPITARIITNDLQLYREYHPVIISPNCSVNLDNYYFISGYDGTLALNQRPHDEFSFILLKELADAIEHQLKNVQTAPVITYTSHMSGGSPSAAA